MHNATTTSWYLPYKADITLKEYEKNKAVKEEKFTVYSNEFKIKEKTTFTKDELKKIIQESTKKYYSSPEEETLEEDFYLGCKTIVYSKEILPHNIAGPAAISTKLESSNHFVL